MEHGDNCVVSFHETSGRSRGVRALPCNSQAHSGFFGSYVLKRRRSLKEEGAHYRLAEKSDRVHPKLLWGLYCRPTTHGLSACLASGDTAFLSACLSSGDTSSLSISSAHGVYAWYPVMVDHVRQVYVMQFGSLAMVPILEIMLLACFVVNAWPVHKSTLAQNHKVDHSNKGRLRAAESH